MDSLEEKWHSSEFFSMNCEVRSSVDEERLEVWSGKGGKFTKKM